MSYYKYCLLFLVAMHTCATAGAQNAQQVIVTGTGDTITLEPQRLRIARVNNVEKKIMISSSVPMLLNGKKIYDYHNDTAQDSEQKYKAQFDSVYAGLNRITYLLDSVTATTRRQLPDGYYHLEVKNIIVDERGRLVYFETGDLKEHYPTANTHPQYTAIFIPTVPAEVIKGIVIKTLESAKGHILLKDGKATPNLQNFSYYFRQKWGRDFDPHALPEWLYK